MAKLKTAAEIKAEREADVKAAEAAKTAEAEVVETTPVPVPAAPAAAQPAVVGGLNTPTTKELTPEMQKNLTEELLGLIDEETVGIFLTGDESAETKFDKRLAEIRKEYPSFNVNAIATTSDKLEYTLLGYAAFLGKVEIMETLLEEYDADANLATLNKSTPLHIAADHKNPNHRLVAKSIELLYSHGAKLDTLDSDGKTPLDIAENRRNKPAIKALKAAKKAEQPSLLERIDALTDKLDDRLIDIKDRVKARDWGNLFVPKLTPELQDAATTKVLETIDHFITRNDSNSSADFAKALQAIKKEYRGMSFNANKYGLPSTIGTPLFAVTSVSHPEYMAVELIKAGANPNMRDRDGGTVLHDAVLNENNNVVQVLLQAGADPNIPDNNGWTALHEAALSGNEDIVITLLQAGADPKAKTTKDYDNIVEGSTALNIAQAETFRGVIDILERAEKEQTEPKKPVRVPVQDGKKPASNIEKNIVTFVGVALLGFIAFISGRGYEKQTTAPSAEPPAAAVVELAGGAAARAIAEYQVDVVTAFSEADVNKDGTVNEQEKPDFVRRIIEQGNKAENAAKEYAAEKNNLGARR